MLLATLALLSAATPAAPPRARPPLLPQEATRASPAAVDEARRLRALAWELHRADADAVLARVRDSADAGERDRLLRAAARSRRGEALIGPLLTRALDQAGEAEVPDPTSLALLAALGPAALDDTLRARLESLRERAAWREAVTVALLRAGAGPEALAGFPVLLGTALADGWRPEGAALGAFLSRADTRAQLWPRLIGRALPTDDLAVLRSLDTADWPAGDALLLRLLRADGEGPSAEHAAALWHGWLTVALPQEAGSALETGLKRHLPWIDADALRRHLDSVSAARRLDGLDLLARIRPPAAAALLREAALDDALDSQLRAVCVQGVFRCGDAADVQALTGLLRGGTPQPVLQALLVGLRIRPAAGIATRLESLMPRLRTQLAGFAVELIVLTGDEEQRLRWLRRSNVLPPNDRLRIAQAAVAVAPGPEVRAWLEPMAASQDPEAQRIARIALAQLLDEDALAALYRDRLEAAPDADARQRVLEQLRELRSDAALEVIVDWLAGPEGRRHPSSGTWAALVVDEPAARRAFRVWWDDRAGLDAQQLDWAACGLAAVDPGARQHLRERLPSVDPRTQLRFLACLEEGAGPEDFGHWLELVRDPPGGADALRRVGGYLLFRSLPESRDEVEAAWDLLEEAAVLAPATAPGRPWLMFVRGSGGALGFAERARLRTRAEALPVAWRTPVLHALAEAELDDPDPRAAPLAEESLFDALAAPLPVLPDEPAPERNALLDQHATLDRALAVLRALGTLDDDAARAAWDADWAARLRRAEASWHPDAVALLATGATPPAWPALHAAARAWLEAVEATGSWRLPPAERVPDALPLAASTDANGFFRQVQERLRAGDRDELEAALDAARKRWIGDRRSHNFSGWLAVAQARPDAARAHFADALALSGWLPQARLEPRLGTACAEALSGNPAPLRALLAEEEQAATLLRGRLGEALPAACAELLPPEEE